MNLAIFRKLTVGLLLLIVTIQIVTFYNSVTSQRKNRFLQSALLQPATPKKSVNQAASNKCLLSTPRFSGIKVYSQNDEDGFLLHLLRCMGGHGTREYFEFGANDGNVGNTRILREHYGWNGHLLDGGFGNSKINLHKEWFTPSNIVGIMNKHKVSRTLDVLSIDTDCDDFWITREILHAGFRPRILINEYNANIPSHLPLTVVPKDIGKETEDLCRGCYFGASSFAFYKLARAYGYALVHSNHVNLFFVQHEEARKLGLAVPSFNDVVPPLEKKLNAPLFGDQCAAQEKFPMRNRWVIIDDKAIARCHHHQINHQTLKNLMSNSTVTFKLSETNDFRFFRSMSS